MSVENVKKFYTILQKDKVLQCKLKDLKLSKVAALDSKKQIELDPIIKKIIPVAKEYDCEFSIKEFKEFREELILQNVAGGFIGACVLPGGGVAKSMDKSKIRFAEGAGILACVVIGLGIGGAGGYARDRNGPGLTVCVVLGGLDVIVDAVKSKPKPEEGE